MTRRRSRVNVELVEFETIGSALEAIGELYRVPPAKLTRVPAVAAFLEALTAAIAVADLVEAGHTRERAIVAAAAELGISTDTLRSRIKAARRSAYIGSAFGSDPALPAPRRVA